MELGLYRTLFYKRRKFLVCSFDGPQYFVLIEINNSVRQQVRASQCVAYFLIFAKVLRGGPPPTQKKSESSLIELVY